MLEVAQWTSPSSEVTRYLPHGSRDGFLVKEVLSWALDRGVDLVGRAVEQAWPGAPLLEGSTIQKTAARQVKQMAW